MRHSGPSVSGLSGPVPLGKNAPGIVPLAENTPMKRFAGLPAAPKLVAGFQMFDVSATVAALNPPSKRRRVNFVQLSVVLISVAPRKRPAIEEGRRLDDRHGQRAQ